MAILLVFVYPGLPITRCPANVEPANAPGHWFCAAAVVLPRPGSCVGGQEVNGSTTVVYLGGYLFSAHLFRLCIAYSNLALNASVVQPAHGLYNITVSSGIGFWGEWHNWTSPENLSGFQWKPASPSDELVLLYAP